MFNGNIQTKKGKILKIIFGKNPNCSGAVNYLFVFNILSVLGIVGIFIPLSLFQGFWIATKGERIISQEEREELKKKIKKNLKRYFIRLVMSVLVGIFFLWFVTTDVFKYSFSHVFENEIIAFIFFLICSFLFGCLLPALFWVFITFYLTSLISHFSFFVRHPRFRYFFLPPFVMLIGGGGVLILWTIYQMLIGVFWG